jgi:hypothetical protein
MYAVRVKVVEAAARNAMETFKQHLDAHALEEEKIERTAEQHGITLDTGVDMPRVIKTFYDCVGPIQRFIAKRQYEKVSHRPRLAPFIMTAQLVQKQGLFAFIQALAVLGFLVSGILFAAFN